MWLDDHEHSVVYGDGFTLVALSTDDLPEIPGSRLTQLTHRPFRLATPITDGINHRTAACVAAAGAVVQNRYEAG